MRSAQFKNRNINMAGNLFLLSGFKQSEQYPAIVCVHPGGGVKEQTAGAYAERVGDVYSAGRQNSATLRQPFWPGVNHALATFCKGSLQTVSGALAEEGGFCPSTLRNSQ